MGPEAPLPAPAILARVIRETTETLAFQCAQPTAQAPAWDELHWCLAQAVAAIQGVSALLSRRLSWRGPRAWHEFLEEQWRHTLQRQQRIAWLLTRIDAAAGEAGLGLHALKGAALHSLQIYAAGERPMADIDLLVREPELTAATAMLATLGYRPSYRTRRERIFVPPATHPTAHFGEHADNPIKIELHTRIAEKLPVREANITERLLSTADSPGLHGYGCSSALMTHLLLHAAGDLRAHSLRLIQLNDIAALSRELDSRSWERVLERDGDWWVYPPLALTARYYRGAIPAPVLAQARAVCPRPLRMRCERQRLSDVSLSDLWVRAFPGVEWCRSLPEAFIYMRQRLFPDPATRAEIRQCEATQLWALNTAWSQASRARRVRRWLLARCPRDVTMAPVRAAWARSGAGPGQLPICDQ